MMMMKMMKLDLTARNGKNFPVWFFFVLTTKKGLLHVYLLFFCENVILQVMFFAVFFICPIFTLEMVVAVELFAKTDLVASPPPISRRAHQVVLTFAVSTIRMSVRLVTVAAFTVVAVTMPMSGKVALPRGVLRAV